MEIRFLFIVTILLSSCASSSLYYDAILTSMNLLQNKNSIEISDITLSDYSSLFVDDDNAQAIFILGEIRNQDRTWVSSDNQKLFSTAGKIYKTHGLKNDILIINPPNIKKIYQELKNSKLKKNFQHFSYIQFSNPATAPLKVAYSYQLKEADGLQPMKLKINSSNYELIERYQLSAFRWKGVNSFLITEEGLVWSSRQELSPSYIIETELLN